MTKKLDANYRENETKFNKLEVPTPGLSEVGKVLMVGEDGKLMYGEGGGSGSGGLKAIKFKYNASQGANILAFLREITNNFDPNYADRIVDVYTIVNRMWGVHSTVIYLDANTTEINFMVPDSDVTSTYDYIQNVNAVLYIAESGVTYNAWTAGVKINKPAGTLEPISNTIADRAHTADIIIYYQEDIEVVNTNTQT